MPASHKEHIVGHSQDGDTLVLCSHPPSDEVRDVLVDACEPLVHAIEQAFHTVPPELAGEIGDGGILLTGGGALLSGLPRYLGERTGLPFLLAPDPANVAIRGAQELLRRSAGTRI